jgi:hypothetical protein
MDRLLEWDEGKARRYEARRGVTVEVHWTLRVPLLAASIPRRWQASGPSTGDMRPDWCPSFWPAMGRQW